MADDLFLNLAYVALVASTFTQTVRRLRLLLVAGSLLFVGFGIVVELWSMVGWNLLIGGMHSYRVVRDLQAERAVSLKPEERAIRDQTFPEVSDFDFHMLWSMGRQTTYADETIIAAGSRPDTVGLILDGGVRIDGTGGDVTLAPGALVGEMSYVSDQVASVDVIATGQVTLHQWEQQDLYSLTRTHPPSAKALEQLITRDLTNKARG